MSRVLALALTGLFVANSLTANVYAGSKGGVKDWLGPFFQKLDKDDFIVTFKEELETGFASQPSEYRQQMVKALELGEAKPQLAYQIISSLSQPGKESEYNRYLYRLLKNYITLQINPKFASDEDVNKLLKLEEAPVALKRQAIAILQNMYYERGEYAKFLEVVDQTFSIDLEIKDSHLNKKVAIALLQTGRVKKYTSFIADLAQSYPLTEDSAWAVYQLIELVKKDPRAYDFKLPYLKTIAKNEEFNSMVPDVLDRLVSMPISYEGTVYPTGFSDFEKLTFFRKVRLYQKAVTIGEKLAADPKTKEYLRPHVLKKLALCYFRLGRYKRSQELYAQSDKMLDGKKSTYLMSVDARNQYYQGNFKKAAKAFKKVAKVSKRPVYRWMTIWNKYLSGNYASALSLLVNNRKSISRKVVGRKGLDYWKAMMYRKTGRRTAANGILADIATSAPFTYYGILSHSKLTTGSKMSAAMFDTSKMRQVAINTSAGNWKIDNIFAALRSSGMKSAELEARAERLKTRYPVKHKDTVYNLGKMLRLDPHIILSIAKAESGFKPTATSQVGAKGLMQLMPYTAMYVAKKLKLKKFKLKHLEEPEVNLALGSYYFNMLLKRYKGNFFLAVAAYNAGPRNVDNWWKVSKYKNSMEEFIEGIPFTETRNYVKKVFKNYVIYSSLYKEDAKLYVNKDAQTFRQYIAGVR